MFRRMPKFMVCRDLCSFSSSFFFFLFYLLPKNKSVTEKWFRKCDVYKFCFILFFSLAYVYECECKIYWNEKTNWYTKILRNQQANSHSHRRGFMVNMHCVPIPPIYSSIPFQLHLALVLEFFDLFFITSLYWNHSFFVALYWTLSLCVTLANVSNGNSWNRKMKWHMKSIFQFDHQLKDRPPIYNWFNSRRYLSQAFSFVQHTSTHSFGISFDFYKMQICANKMKAENRIE